MLWVRCRLGPAGCFSLVEEGPPCRCRRAGVSTDFFRCGIELLDGFGGPAGVGFFQPRMHIPELGAGGVEAIVRAQRRSLAGRHFGSLHFVRSDYRKGSHRPFFGRVLIGGNEVGGGGGSRAVGVSTHRKREIVQELEMRTRPGAFIGEVALDQATCMSSREGRRCRVQRGRQDLLDMAVLRGVVG